MDTEGTQDAPHTAAPPPGGTHRTDPTVPRPAAPPAAPADPATACRTPLHARTGRQGCRGGAAGAGLAAHPATGRGAGHLDVRTRAPARRGTRPDAAAAAGQRSGDLLPLRLAAVVAAVERLPGELLAVAAAALTPDSWREAGGTRWSTSVPTSTTACSSLCWPSSSAGSAAGPSRAPFLAPCCGASRPAPAAAPAPAADPAQWPELRAPVPRRPPTGSPRRPAPAG